MQPVVIRMRPRDGGAGIDSPLMPYYVAEQVFAHLNVSQTWDGQPIQSAIIVPLGLSGELYEDA